MIRSALARLNDKLAARDATGELCLFGGAVMALVFDARQSTRDVDATMRPKRELAEAASDVAEEFDLPLHWLNDGVKGFVSPEGQLTEEGVPQFSHLRILRPTAEYLLAMKCLAARSDIFDDSQDRGDVLALLRHLNLKDAASILAIVQQFYPESQLSVKTRYFVEEVAQQLKAAP